MHVDTGVPQVQENAANLVEGSPNVTDGEVVVNA